jgi:protein disulfide isomerase
MLVQVSGSVKKFKYDRGISTDEIVKYIKDWKNGKIEQYFKSQDIPESNDEAVKTIVGKNYREEILNTNRDVLIEFYAPWCGHCKQIAPIYESVAQKLAGNKNILIAKVDATANEIPGVNIRGYPTIYFIPGNSKQMVTFEGDRTEEGILAWLKEHTTHPWDAATRDEAVRDEAVRDENVKDEL